MLPLTLTASFYIYLSHLPHPPNRFAWFVFLCYFQYRLITNSPCKELDSQPMTDAGSPEIDLRVNSKYRLHQKIGSGSFSAFSLKVIPLMLMIPPLR